MLGRTSFSSTLYTQKPNPILFPHHSMQLRQNGLHGMHVMGRGCLGGLGVEMENTFSYFPVSLLITNGSPQTCTSSLACTSVRKKGGCVGCYQRGQH